MTLFRLLKWIAGVFIALIVLLALFVVFFDWNALRQPIAGRIGEASGRPFAINGDLSVALSLRPRIVANDIVLGNAAWSDEPHMAEIKRLAFTVDLLKLLSGRVEFPEIVLSEPRIVLEVNRDGAPNWAFGEKRESKSFGFPAIGALSIDHGKARYRDQQLDTDLAFEIKTLAGASGDSPFGLEVAGQGRFKGLPTVLRGQGGALLSLRSAGQTYPIKASGTLGATRASIEGRLLDPLHLKGEELEFSLEGSDLGALFTIIGVPIPPTSAYRLTGYLEHAGDLWTFRRFKGTVGHSDLAGDFAVDRGQQPQMIRADVVSRQLLMEDLGGFIGADRGSQPSRNPPPGDRVLPSELFNLEKLKAANADVRFRGEKIVTEKMPLTQMNAHLVVSDGVLKLAPVDFGVAGGNLTAQIEMDGRQPRIATHAQIVAKGLQLNQLFPGSKLAGGNTGVMGGRANLDGAGNSIARMLASANGEAALIMDGGSVGELMLRLANLDIANSLLLLLGGDKQVPIRCMVGNFKVIDGDFTIQDLVLDTPKVNITGVGNIDFADESLRLRLVPQSKGFSLASLRGPIAIGGTFKSPTARPEMGGVAARGGLAVALGVATGGLGTLLPLLDFGKDEDSNCAALISQAKSDAGVKAGDMQLRSGK